MIKEARFWEKLDDGYVRCVLCSHNCKIKNDKTGICGVRRNHDGKLETLIYGSCSSVASDPIEKKPLYHFHPGTQAFSVGTIGCNFKCLHCQNYSISTADMSFPYLRELTPEETVLLAKQYACEGIAYTYNEPTIWYEFTFDSARLAKKDGLYTVYVTNGYISEEPLRELSGFLDAMNVDIKAFTDKFYRKVCKAKLEPVLKTCELAKELGIHLELTYLVIPGYNDSVDEVKQFSKWVVDKLDKDVPVHFSRFHPDYKMQDVSSTPMNALLKAYDAAKEAGVSFVYLGNVPRGDYDNTYCPVCGNLCIERIGYRVSLDGLVDGKCSKCGSMLPVIL